MGGVFVFCIQTLDTSGVAWGGGVEIDYRHLDRIDYRTVLTIELDQVSSWTLTLTIELKNKCLLTRCVLHSTTDWSLIRQRFSQQTVPRYKWYYIYRSRILAGPKCGPATGYLACYVVRTSVRCRKASYGTSGNTDLSTHTPVPVHECITVRYSCTGTDVPGTSSRYR